MSRWRRRGAAAAAAAAAVLSVPSLARASAHLLEGCLGWVAAATALELLSIGSFVLVFTFAFRAAGVAGAGPAAGLRSLAAATVLPAGGLVGPVAGALGSDADATTVRRLARSSIGLVALTSAPLLVAVAAVGMMLRLGWLDGPRATALTLLPAALALGTGVVAWYGGRRAPGEESRLAVLRGGLADARALALRRDWRLIGGVAYYAFDNAVLWAAFHALGRTPPIPALVMGYVLGSLASSLPTPAGLGALEGGLVGGLVLYGAAAGPAVAAVLLYRAISLSVPLLVGGAAWLERLAPLRRARAAGRIRARTSRPHLQYRRAGTPR